MNQDKLSRQLECAVHRIRRDRFVRWNAISWLSAALVLGAFCAVQVLFEEITFGVGVALTVAVAALLLLSLVVLARSRRVSRLDAARSIEKLFPELNERLLADVEQQPNVETGQYTFLQRQVIDEATRHGEKGDWLAVVSPARFAQSLTLQFLCFGLFIAAGGVLWQGRPESPDGEPRFFAIGPTAQKTAVEYGLSVEPGDTEIDRGSDLLVVARFDKQLPSDVTLVYSAADRRNKHIDLTKGLDDPLFAGRLPGVDRDFTYHVEYDTARSEDFRVSVFEYPQLERLDATVTYPDYTALPEAVIEDTDRISIVEGSSVKLTCRLNKPIASARLIAEDDDQENDDQTVPLHAVSEQGDVFEVTLTPKQDRRYRLQLLDKKGRRNKYPPEFVVEIVPNRRPELKLAFPAKDLRVSPLEELALEATAWDDFGLKQYGVIYAHAGQGPSTVVLGESVAGKKHLDITHLLSFENLGVEPDQLVSYYFYADDYDPDGEVRRTYSDMYFAEVRHFEEIFRQGRQPPGGQSRQQQRGSGQQAQQAEKLAQLQKQIINATWKVFRRETAHEPSRDFKKDVELIKTSQDSALQQLRKLGEKVRDAKSKVLATAIAGHMTEASETLKQAAETGDVSQLSPALTSEQAAYQALLKLRTREHKVVRGQSSGASSASSSSADGNRSQQLNQLELTNKQNRYQSGRNASANRASAANREQLQILNRLRELARRQSGLNEKLKELENALREAQTEQERQEIRRQLKRLRDEQQQMLRDLDKLRNRMDRPENQQRMAEDSRRLDQTRSRILQASEALKQGQLSRALNSGTRAERELRELQEEFRKRTAGQLSGEMRDLRDRSRRLANRQNQLADKLKQLDEGKSRALRDSRDRKHIARGLSEQKQKLDAIFNRMEDVIRKSDTSERLLSRGLYETLRKAREEQPSESLELSSRLLSRGLMPEASEMERQANRGIQTVKRGIEKAAAGVLGNETEALKRAQNELKQLTKSLGEEVAEADPRQRRTAQRTGTNQRTRSGNPNAEPKQPNQQRQANAQDGSQSNGSGAGQNRSRGRSGLKNNTPSQTGRGTARSLSSFLNPGGEHSAGPGHHTNTVRPLTGKDFQDWSDRLRDVEEMIEDPKLRAEVAGARDRARSVRVEFKRHSKEPNWDLVRVTILQPLVELESRLSEEIAKREQNGALVPIDRDPVPERFSELVRRYYERLGSGQWEGNPKPATGNNQ